MKVSWIVIFTFFGASISLAAKAPIKEGELWDAWFTATIGKKTHFSYSNQHVESKSGRIAFQEKTWKKEEGFINEEQLGAFAADDDRLTPLFFNLRSVYRTTETIIDANVEGGKSLSVRVRRAGKELPIIRRSIPAGVFFSSLFPVWLRKKQNSLQLGKNQSFQVIIEDNIDGNFDVVSGSVRLEARDAHAKSNNLTRITVTFADQKSTWYLDQKGLATKIEIPSINRVVERVAEATAKKFLTP